MIHGGMTFDAQEEYISFLETCEVSADSFKSKTDWKASLSPLLGSKFEVFTPRMPNGTNARYGEWKLWFERLLPFIGDESIFVGHSLGGIFCAKYFSENDVPKKVKAMIFVAAPFDGAAGAESLGDFILPKSLEKLGVQGGVLYFFHSKDDPVVPFAQVEKYKEHLPSAKVYIFEDHGHFNQESLPEMVELIRSL